MITNNSFSSAARNLDGSLTFKTKVSPTTECVRLLATVPAGVKFHLATTYGQSSGRFVTAFFDKADDGSRFDTTAAFAKVKKFNKANVLINEIGVDFEFKTQKYVNLYVVDVVQDYEISVTVVTGEQVNR